MREIPIFADAGMAVMTSAGDRAAMALKGTLLLLCLGGAFLAFQSPRDSEMLTPVKLLSEEAATAKSDAELHKELTEAFRSAVKHAKAASAPISDVNIPVVRGPPNQKTPSVANGSENTFVTAESHLWTAVAGVEHEGEEEAAAAVQKVVRKRQESASEEEAKKEAEEETATVEMDDAKKEAVEARTNEEEEANLHANVRAKAHDDVRAPTAAASPGPMGLDTDVRAPTAAAGPGPVGLDTVQPQTSSVESTDSLEKELENAAAAVKEGKSWSIADLLGSESVVAPAPTTSSPSDVSKHVDAHPPQDGLLARFLQVKAKKLAGAATVSAADKEAAEIARLQRHQKSVKKSPNAPLEAPQNIASLSARAAREMRRESRRKAAVAADIARLLRDTHSS